MWRDGATHAKSKPIQDALKAVLAIELPSENFQKVAESEKDQIEERMETAEKQIQRLINYLREKGYDDAATYIQRSKKYLFGYVRRWLKLGISCPRASSLIERTCLISELSKLKDHHKLLDITKILLLRLCSCKIQGSTPMLNPKKTFIDPVFVIGGYATPALA